MKIIAYDTVFYLHLALDFEGAIVMLVQIWRKHTGILVSFELALLLFTQFTLLKTKKVLYKFRFLIFEFLLKYIAAKETKRQRNVVVVILDARGRGYGGNYLTVWDLKNVTIHWMNDWPLNGTKKSCSAF